MRYADVKTTVVFNNDTEEEVARFPFIIDHPNHGLPDWVFGFNEDGSFNKDSPTYCYLETDDNGTWGFTGGHGVDWTGQAETFKEALHKVTEWLNPPDP